MTQGKKCFCRECGTKPIGMREKVRETGTREEWNFGDRGVGGGVVWGLVGECMDGYVFCCSGVCINVFAHMCALCVCWVLFGVGVLCMIWVCFGWCWVQLREGGCSL